LDVATVQPGHTRGATLSLLEIDALTVEARLPAGGWRPTLRDISLRVDRGEVVALIGESGAGKTTLALAALGYARPGTRIVVGSIKFDGADIRALRRPALQMLRGGTIAYVAQSASAALDPAMRVGAQITESLAIHRIAAGAEARERVLRLLSALQFSAPERVVERYPQQLSGGQLQRIMLAMALCCAPQLLILDEPTTALDMTTQVEVLKAIKDTIRPGHVAAIYVSHDLAVVAQLADRIVVMRNGDIVEVGATARMLSAPRQDYTRALLAAAHPKPAIRHRSSSSGPPVSGATDPPLLRLQGVDATYRLPALFGRAPTSVRALKDVSVDIRRREVLAVVGESGSGKSTLARVVAGLLSPRRGHVLLDGDPLPAEARRRHKEQLRRVQIVFQSPELSLNPRRSVGRSIGRALEFYFGLRGKAQQERIEQLLDLVQISPELGHRFPSELSGGQRQRIAIARAFAAEPDLIICDEILSALDTIVSQRIVELMRDLRERQNVAYIFISHDLGTVAAIADRVAVMYAGRLVEIGSPADVFGPLCHPYTQLLLQSMPELRQGWLKEVVDTPVEQTGSGPGAIFDGPGCEFQPRCRFALSGKCREERPPLRQMAPNHAVVCHRRADELRQGGAFLEDGTARH